MTHKPLFAILAVTASAFAIGGCSTEDMAPGAGSVDRVEAPDSATLIGPSGAPLGTVAVKQNNKGLMLTIAAKGLPPGAHGIHLHQTGLCDGPKFVTAGGHWNPGMKQHGRDNPAGAHAGDLPNLIVRADGTARVTIPVSGAIMASGAMMLADSDGTAIVIHAKPDDYKTDPSGASGDRIACAVVARPD